MPRGKRREYVGETFGNLLVLEEVERNKQNQRMFLCRCSCGNESVVRGGNLSNGQLSCGCVQKEIAKQIGHNNIKDLTGRCVNKWKIIRLVDKTDSAGNKYYLCECSCKNKTRKVVCGNSIIKGSSKSCGCIRNQKSSKRLRERNLNRPKEQHYRYNPNLTEEQRVKRRIFTTEIKEWCKSVYKKDNYKCVFCGSKKKLNAHHLNAWNLYPEERFDVENGITLCEVCHIIFHKECGYGDNNREQFEEWVSDPTCDR